MASPDELWIVDFGDPFRGEPAYHRLALVVGPDDVFGPRFPFAFVVPLTTVRRELSLHVEIEPDAANGLAEPSYAQCELLRSVSVRRLLRPLGTIDLVTRDRVTSILRALLGL